MTPADWQDCGEAGGGAYGGDHKGVHRGNGRHRPNAGREIAGQTAKPHGAPGEQKAPGVQWVAPGDDRPPR